MRIVSSLASGFGAIVAIIIVSGHCLLVSGTCYNFAQCQIGSQELDKGQTLELNCATYECTEDGTLKVCSNMEVYEAIDEDECRQVLDFEKCQGELISLDSSSQDYCTTLNETTKVLSGLDCSPDNFCEPIINE